MNSKMIGESTEPEGSWALFFLQPFCHNTPLFCCIMTAVGTIQAYLLSVAPVHNQSQV